MEVDKSSSCLDIMQTQASLDKVASPVADPWLLVAAKLKNMPPERRGRLRRSRSSSSSHLQPNEAVSGIGARQMLLPDTENLGAEHVGLDSTTSRSPSDHQLYGGASVPAQSLLNADALGSSLAMDQQLRYLALRNQMLQQRELAYSLPPAGTYPLVVPPSQPFYPSVMQHPSVMMPTAASIMAPYYMHQLDGLSASLQGQQAVPPVGFASEPEMAASAGVPSVASLPQNNDTESYGGEQEEASDPPVHRYKRESWDIMFERLLKYKAAHGDCAVPQDYKGIPKLGNWVQKQRTLKKSNRLLPDREQRLDAVGFVWRIQESWDFMYQCLVEYKEKHGDCNVPKHYSEDRKLGKWVRVQRMRRKILSEDRLKRLHDIGFK